MVIINNMNVIKFHPKSIVYQDVVFCCIDNSHEFFDSWTNEIVKNQADYTINNLCSKDYSVFQGKTPDALLCEVKNSYNFALFFSLGTEFINGEDFFEELKKQCDNNFVIRGHILDRGEAYYELHKQCFLVNLTNYKKIGSPKIGSQILGESHKQIIPIRSKKNYHDDYTPLEISPGTEEKKYSHKCHGHNIISKTLENGYKITAFNSVLRNSKMHLYPESEKDFYSAVKNTYKKDRYCFYQHVHTDNTEEINQEFVNLRQILTPASGQLFFNNLDLSKKCKVIVYDYNDKSIDYWRINAPQHKNVEYEFVNCDLLINSEILLDHVDKSLENSTLFQLSNIFCYEGTSVFYNLKFRNYQEKFLLEKIKKHFPNSYINFSGRALIGFVENIKLFERAKNMTIYNLEDCAKPTWHVNDWL